MANTSPQSSAQWQSLQKGQGLVQELPNATLARCWCLVMLVVVRLFSYHLFRIEVLP